MAQGRDLLQLKYYGNSMQECAKKAGLTYTSQAMEVNQGERAAWRHAGGPKWADGPVQVFQLSMFPKGLKLK